MKVKIIITANIKKPKVGDSYGDYGLDGRSGYFECPIKMVKKTHIVVGGKMINIKSYAFKTAMNKLNKKVKVIISKT